MRRRLLGILSILLLLSAVIGLIVYGTGNNQASMVVSMCLRIGLVLGALWLAFPQLIRLSATSSPWMIVGFAVGISIVVVRPRTIVVLGPILCVLAMLHLAGIALKPKK